MMKKKKTAQGEAHLKQQYSIYDHMAELSWELQEKKVGKRF